MTKHINPIYLILLVLCILVVYLFKENNDKGIMIDNISKAVNHKNMAKRDSLVKIIEQQRFREDFYINQFSIKSDYVIFYVTILFGMSAFIGYLGITERIENLTSFFNSTIESKTQKYEEYYQEHIKEFSLIKSDFLAIKKDTYLLLAKNYIEFGGINKNNQMGFLSYLLVSHCYFKIIEIEDNESHCEKYLTMLVAALEKSYESLGNIKQKDNVLILKNDLIEIRSKIFEINKYYDTRIMDLCAKIIIKINEIDNL